MMSASPLATACAQNEMSRGVWRMSTPTIA
jgi:hypothetical protein